MKLQVQTRDFTGSAFANRRFDARVPNDASIEDILSPAFWSIVFQQVNVGTIIDIMSFDMQLDMQVRVVKVEQGLVTVRPRIIVETPDRIADFKRRSATAAAVDDPNALPSYDTENYKVGYAPNAFGVGKGAHYAEFRGTNPPIKIAEKLPSKRAAIEAVLVHASKAGLAPVPQPAAPAETANL